MKRIDVNLGEKSYNVFIGNGTLNKIPNYLINHHKDAKAIIITDRNVEPLYGAKILKELISAKIQSDIISLPPGEGTKSIEVLSKLYEKLVELKVSRTDVLIAVGGGVIGDLTGFLAATYLRGISYIGVPTTLLAQIDSSIGGKTAVNLPSGKNLVGAFHQPKAVFIDTNTLKTLLDVDFAGGMAEIIKTACIKDAVLFEELKSNMGRKKLMLKINDIIHTCVKIKCEVVEEDVNDTGERMKLNFGHTLAHALEKAKSAPQLTHGEAVAIGIVDAAKRSYNMGLASKKIIEEIIKLNEGYKLPVEIPQGVDFIEINEIISRDKKVLNNKLNIILLNKIGEAKIQPIDAGDFL